MAEHHRTTAPPVAHDGEPDAPALPLRRRWIAQTHHLSGEPRRLLEAAIAAPAWLPVAEDRTLPAPARERRVLDRVTSQYKLTGLTHVADCGEVTITDGEDVDTYAVYAFEFGLVAEPRRLYVLDDGCCDFLYPVAVDEPDPEGLRAELFLPGGLFELVRQHPMYAFGAVITSEDFDGSFEFATCEEVRAHDWGYEAGRLRQYGCDLAHEAEIEQRRSARHRRT
jgi:hypothetical protein